MWLRVLIFIATVLVSLPVGESSFGAYAPYPSGCSLEIPISQTTSTDLKTFTNNGYICYIYLTSATAQNVSVVQGTGTICATSKVALVCNSTASCAVGVTGGFVLSLAPGNYVKTTAVAQHLCLLQDGTGNVSGVIGYMDAP